LGYPLPLNRRAFARLPISSLSRQDSKNAKSGINFSLCGLCVPSTLLGRLSREVFRVSIALRRAGRVVVNETPDQAVQKALMCETKDLNVLDC
jgi:hypothetical protein